MRYSFAFGAVLAASVSGALANDCSYIEGNYYCKAVDSVAFSNFGHKGTYNKVTSFNEGGTCGTAPQDYEGPLAPLNGEVAWAFRGPLELKQFAFYTKGSGLPSKREVKPSIHERRHGHSHLHRRHQEGREQAAKEAAAKRAVGDIVTATYNGDVFTFINQWDGSKTVPLPTDGPNANKAAPAPAPAAPSSQSEAGTPASNDAPAPSFNPGIGKWGRQAYYNAADNTADGLTFLANYGGQGSGVWDQTFGNSLSYVKSDCTAGSEAPEILHNKMIPDAKEIVIMSDKKCEGDSCGFTRPGGVAYHGFEAGSKLFLLEFSMPMTGARGWNQDMPAAWILNSQIPLTQQYPANPDCSCWKSGCGEFDVFEVLNSGNTRCVASVHSNHPGTDTNYFNRPVDKPIKVAVLFADSTKTAHIKVLDDQSDAAFPMTVDSLDVAGFAIESTLSSIFNLPN